MTTARVLAGTTAILVVLTAGCSGGDGGAKADGPLDAKGVAAALDARCEQIDQEYAALGVSDHYGWQSVADLNTATAAIRTKTATVFGDIEAEDAAQQKSLDELVKLVKGGAAEDEAVAAAAKNQDQKALDAAYAKVGSQYDDRIRLYKKLGSEACAQDTPIEPQGSGTEAPTDLEAVTVADPVEPVAEAFAKAVIGGDTKTVDAMLHSDYGSTLDDNDKNYLKTLLTDAKVRKAETYGPVAQVDFSNKNGYFALLTFVADRGADGPEWKFAGVVDHYVSGLNPAPKGNDSDANMKSFYDAAVSGDAAAFNETLYLGKDSPFRVTKGFEGLGDATSGLGRDLVQDLRSEKTAPVLLGRNVAYSNWFVPGSKNDWVLVQVHVPGGDPTYVFTAYWPVPKP